MKKLIYVITSMSCLMAIVCAIALVGCETNKGTSNIIITDENGNTSVTLEGSDNSSTLIAVIRNNNTDYNTSSNQTSTGVTAFVSATALTTNMALPLVWTVSDSTLGSIQNNSGVTALYWRTGKNGDNIITCKDQYSNEGFITIRQNN